MTEIQDVIEKTIKQLFDVDIEVEIARPDLQFGDYSTNVALKLAKDLGKNPKEIAKKISDELSKIEDYSDVAVAGPGFINITLLPKKLAQDLQEAFSKNGKYGSSDIGKGKTVICEFPSPNIAKPFSVGHIRSALQGWSVYKLMDFMGYEVIRDNHLGDHGTPFGKWVVGFQKYSSEDELNEKGIDELARIYIAITNDLKEEESDEMANEVQEWLVKLEKGDEEAVEYYDRFKQISLDHMHEIMDRLQIETDIELGESFYLEKAASMTDELIKKGIAVESKGAIIVSLEDQGIKTPVMLRKANGAMLYATTDLATIDYREKKWQPEKVFIHVGQEQVFYFKQLNALARKLGYSDNINHLWHGLVDQLDKEGNRGKMSSRKGVVLLSDMLDRAEEEAAKLSKSGNKDDIKAVALGAVKFADFKADRKTGVLFDWEDMFSVNGMSGPAIQYAAVRIKSILRKTNAPKDIANIDYNWQPERQLILKMLDFPDLMHDIHDSYELHKLAHYLYELAKELNRYYEHTRIVDASESEREARAWLMGRILEVLTTGLDILGIQIPEEM